MNFSPSFLLSTLPLLVRPSTLDDSFVRDVMASLASIKPVLVLDPDQISFSQWDEMLPTAIGTTDPQKVRDFFFK